jgi:oligopeptide/dipeptide ABC transporter ATP-binding protein
MSAIPVPDPKFKRQRIILPGDVPSPLNPPSGCRFHPRCPVAIERCKTDDPPLEELKPGHWVACWVAREQVTAGQAGPVIKQPIAAT